MDGPEALPPATGLEVADNSDSQQLLSELPSADSVPHGVKASSRPPLTEGLEVVHPKSAEQIYELPSTDALGVNEGEKVAGDDGRPLLKEKRRICGLRRREFWLVLIIILVAIAAVVIGAVLGTQKHGASSNGSAAATATATATVTAISPDLPTSASTSTPTSIRPKSKLAVTGWRTGQEYSIWLFYQDPEDNLRYSIFESTSGKWAAPAMSVKAAAGSSIGVTAFNHSIYGGDNNMQIQLYYLDSSSYIREQDFYPGATFNGSLSQENYKASSSSGLSTYWPSLIYEDDGGTFHEVTYGGFEITNIWNAETIGQSGEGLLGSGLAELTTTLNYTNLTLFYQTLEGRLVQRGRDSGSNNWSSDSTIATIPNGSSIGALSVLAANGTGSNTYVLWQDTTGNIQVSDSNSGWTGSSTSDALKNADNGTSITCLTPVTWYHVSMGSGPSLGRCYFQVNSAVREVEVEGGRWSVLGDVPIP